MKEEELPEARRVVLLWRVDSCGMEGKGREAQPQRN